MLQSLCYDGKESVVKNIKHLSVQIQCQQHVKEHLTQYDQAEFLINTEDTVFSFTTYAPLTFYKGDFQVSKECAFNEQRYYQPR